MGNTSAAAFVFVVICSMAAMGELTNQAADHAASVNYENPNVVEIQQAKAALPFSESYINPRTGAIRVLDDLTNNCCNDCNNCPLTPCTACSRRDGNNNDDADAFGDDASDSSDLYSWRF